MSKLTPPRVHRIESTILKDPELKALIKGPKKAEVRASEGERPVMFNAEVVRVAEALVEQGHDPYTARKNVILEVAKAVLTGSQPEPPATPEGSIPETAETDGDSVAVNPHFGILSLLLSTKQLMDHDKTASADSRRKRVVELIDEVSRLVR